MTEETTLTMFYIPAFFLILFSALFLSPWHIYLHVNFVVFLKYDVY